VLVDPLNRREIDALSATPRRADVTVGFVAPPLGFARGGRKRLATTLVGQGLPLAFNLPITRGSLAVIELIQLDRRLQGKQRLRSPMALQGPGNLRFAMLAVPVT